MTDGARLHEPSSKAGLVRPFRTADLIDVLRVAAASLDQSYDPQLFLTLAESSPDLFLVASDDDRRRVDGFVLGVVAAASEVRILLLAVDPSRRRSGVGSRLLKALASAFVARGVRMVRLEVRADNEGARAFYREHGFEEVGLDRGVYDDGADAVLMRRRVA